MLDIETGEQIEALYKLIQVNGGKTVEKFKTTDINQAIEFHKNYVNKYKTGLLLEIIPKKKIYDWKNKTVKYLFEDNNITTEKE